MSASPPNAAKEKHRAAAAARVWALALVAAICAAAPAAIAHARALGAAAAPENSRLGLARNFVTVDVGAERAQASKSLLENTFAYGDLASGSAYATRGGPKLLTAIRTPSTLAEAVGNRGQVLVNQALKGRTPLSQLTNAERAEGAKFFRGVAEQTKGAFKDAAAAFNRLRADYLEGLTDEVPGTLPDFMSRHGYGP
jgi:hypothetical protein